MPVSDNCVNLLLFRLMNGYEWHMLQNTGTYLVHPYVAWDLENFPSTELGHNGSIMCLDAPCVFFTPLLANR